MSKKTTSIMAVIVLLLLILAGTFAWRQYNQHKTNEANGPGLRYDVSLIEDFEEIESWKVSDAAKKKIIKVSNSGLTDGSYGDVYVRLQLKEYLEMAKLKYIYTDYRLMIGTDGEFIKATTAEALNGKLTDLGYDSNSHESVQEQGIEDEQKYYYAKTRAGDDNGQYGKFLLLSASSADAVSLIDGKERATDTESHDLATNGECNYTVHVWKEGSCEDCGLGFHEYIVWYLGEDVISLEEWLDLDGPYARLPVEKWIYDTRSINTEGWVYWGAALKPQETTSNLLEAVKLIKQPDDNFYYALHVDMEAVSLGEITTAQELKWTDAPPLLLTSFTTPVVAGIAWLDDAAIPAVLARGTTISMMDLLDVNVLNGSLGDAELEWCFTPTYAVSPFSLGMDEVTETKDGSRITKDGVLTIEAGETALSLMVKARSKTNANIGVSIPIPIGGPQVTSISVPAVAGTVTVGTTYTMGVATVKGIGSPSPEVEWTLSGNTSKDTTIGADRVLHVALDETAESITVTATSTYDNKKSCLVTVNIASVTGVTVTTGNVEVYKGYTKTFAASVAGVNSPAQDVTWSVEGAESEYTKFNGATLKVDSNETKTTFKVRATSTINKNISNAATVTVAILPDNTPKVVDIKVTGATVNAGDYVTLAAPTVTVVNGADQTVIWEIKDKTSTATQFDTTTMRLDVGVDEEAETFRLIATSTADTTVSGIATITVRRVTGVTVTTGDASVIKGYTQTFAASVAGVNSPAQTVKWSVEGAESTDTYMSGAILKVGFGETAETLTVRATSTVDPDPSKSGTATVTVTELGTEPQVTDIKVSNTTVNTGSTTTLSEATTIVVNDAPQTVTWVLAGNTSADTKIDSATRELTVGMDETASTFQVIAISTYDTTKSGAGTITVRRATGVTVTPDEVTVYKGYTQTFAASVAGINSPAQTVTWSVIGAGSEYTQFSGATLTVDANEPKTSFTVRATSSVTNTIYGEATVRVAELEAETPQVVSIAVTGTTTLNTGASTTLAASVTAVNGADESVTWSVSGNTSADTKINSGTRLLEVGMDEEASTFQVTATSTADPTKIGTAIITVARVTSVTLNTYSAVVAKGDTQGFIASIAGVNSPGTGVTWAITTEGISADTKISVTSNSWNSLIVGSDETNTELTIRVTSNVTTTVYGEATVRVLSAGYPTWEESTADITGKAADVGKKFTADGYTWRVLAVDGSGNMLVTSTEVLSTTKTPSLAANGTRFSPTGNDYAGSTLEGVMTKVYNNGIPTLQPHVQAVNIKTESQAEWSTTAIRDSGLSVVDGTGDATAFALSTSEANKYFIDNADRQATRDGEGFSYWLRSPGQGASYVFRIGGYGDALSNTAITATIGLRPALWINRNSLVGVSPTTVNILKGRTQDFNATVSSLADYENKTVEWEVIGSTPSGSSTISDEGVLTVGSGETAETLTVKVSLVADASQYATATVYVNKLTVGEIFEADGYEWKVLKEDDAGNYLIHMTTMDTELGYVKFNTSTSLENAYAGSNLEDVIKSTYNNATKLPTLHQYMQKVVIQAETYSASIIPEGLSYVSEEGDKTAFILSRSEATTYYASNADRIDTANIAAGGTGSYWLRSPGSVSTHAVRVSETGSVNNNNVTNATTGVRVAMWINLGD